MTRQLIGTHKLIDQTKKNAFNLDTILLANFIKLPFRTKTVMDIGAGNGALMLYLADRTSARIIGVEIQEENAKLAQKNILLNGLESRLSVIHDDIKNVHFKDIDYIVCNPPFFKVNALTKKHLDPAIAMARHEISLTFTSLVKKVSQLLKNGGYFYFIHRPDRISELIHTLEENQLTVKRMRFVHPYIHREANHVLIAAKKGSTQGTKLEKPFILYKQKNIYSNELKALMEVPHEAS